MAQALAAADAVNGESTESVSRAQDLKGHGEEFCATVVKVL